MRTKTLTTTGLLLLALLTAACVKGGTDFKKARRAESRRDFDTALIHYERAHRADPDNAVYQIRVQRTRFEAGQMHVDLGNKYLEQGLLEPALAEFEKGRAIDPGSFIADQQADRTRELISQRNQAEEAAAASAAEPPRTLARLDDAPAGPPQLKPLSRRLLNLKMEEDAKAVYQAIGDLGGINVVFDPDFQSRRVPVELKETTVEEALDIVALITKTFWKVVTPNTILVVPDQQAKRLAHEEQVIKTFYLSNITEPTELNELVQTLRQLLDIKRITPSTIHNAIIIRDTPDKIAVAEKIIHDVDRAKPEVVIQVAVLQARRDRARDLGILPSTTVPLLFTPRTTVGGADGGGGLPLNELDNLSSADYSIVLPSATAMALLTDSTTRIIQNPQIRTTDGETAKLNIGDKVPFAVGSFQPGIGGVGINPLVNTQFQFQDVGVNIDVTPHVHANGEITLDIMVEISSVTGQVSIGGITQPIFGQRKIEHKIRLKEGEVSILGGIIERIDEVSLEGIPGLSRVPFLKFLFSTETKTQRENEVLIVLTPRVIRLPEISELSRRALAIGTDSNISLPRSLNRRTGEIPPGARPGNGAAARETAATSLPAAETSPPASRASFPAITFAPPEAPVAVGQQAAVTVVVTGAEDLFSVAFALRYDPQIARLVNIGHGGFFGGDELPPALIHRIDEQNGQAIVSISRPPSSEGVSGDGAIVTLIFEAVSPGRMALTIRQVSARNSSQRIVPLDVQPAVLTVE